MLEQGKRMVKKVMMMTKIEVAMKVIRALMEKAQVIVEKYVVLEM